MKIIATTTIALGLGLAAAMASTQEDEDKGVKVGTTPSFTFQQPLLNGKGVKSLADLRGKPTLIDFWGTR